MSTLDRREFIQLSAASMLIPGVQAAVVAVVPYGTGELTVKRETGRAADMIEHCFGGESQTKRLLVENGHLRVPLRERSERGSLVEWIEVKVHNGCSWL